MEKTKYTKKEKEIIEEIIGKIWAIKEYSIPYIIDEGNDYQEMNSLKLEEVHQKLQNLLDKLKGEVR